MIKRELYMKRIRPFIGNDLIKVMTGVRRAGKSVMLELVQEELLEAGVSQSQFICINFENMQYAHLQTAQNLHSEILERAAEIKGKVYLFFDEIQEAPRGLTALKYFQEKAPQYHLVPAASLLGIAMHSNDSFPVGKVDFMDLYPLSFSEFLEAVGQEAFARLLAKKTGG